MSLAAKAVETQGKGGVLATKAVETQGKATVVARQWKHKAKAVSYLD